MPRPRPEPYRERVRVYQQARSFNYAQMLGLNSRPGDVITAPGDDRVIVPVSVVATFTPDPVTPFDAVGNLNIFHETDEIVSWFIQLSGIIDAAERRMTFSSWTTPVYTMGNAQPINAGLRVNFLDPISGGGAGASMDLGVSYQIYDVVEKRFV